MTEREASGTAVGVAMLRAAHMLIDGEPKILVDPVSPRLFDAAVLEGMRADPGRLRTPGALALRSHVVLRSRFAEDRMRDAHARGVRQCVMLGAGLDTFACRQPAWAREMEILEVDHPASGRFKRARLEAAGIDVPPNVRFVPCDLEAELLGEALRASPFDPGRPAVVAMLGVLVYLSGETADAVLRWAGGLAPGSEMVFTCSPPHAERGDGGALAARAAALGETWRTRWGPGELRPKLEASGFAWWDFPAPELLARLYYQGRTDGLEPPRRATTCVAGT